MPNQRKPGQKLLTLPASEDFISAMDAGLAELGCSNRSGFIREAIVEKLQRERIRIPKTLAAAPARFTYPVPSAQSSALNETHSSRPKKEKGP